MNPQAQSRDHMQIAVDKVAKSFDYIATVQRSSRL
jgi:hypothetical protein